MDGIAPDRFGILGGLYSRFTATLDGPPAENPRLRRLLTRKSPWEQ